MKALLFALGILLAVPSLSRADEVYTFVIKKQEEKAKSRWSLSEWLETRDRMRLMDLWLALHSPSPYEFVIKYDYRVSDDRRASFPGDSRLGFAAYVSIFGLEVEKALGSSSPTSLWFNARVFGFYAQSTNITLQAGVRSQGSPGYRNAFWGVASTINLFPQVGLDGYWRSYFDSTPGAPGRVSGNRWEAGAFIDFSFLRLYGNWFGENVAVNDVDDRHSGVILGTKLFF